MLAGEAAVAIWNGVTPEGRAEFYAWHLHEHMAERVGIPGFRRGRRFIALDGMTRPEFFTLYEADTMQVLQGQDYANRLNAPSAWTKRATQGFRDTSRGLARVVASHGVGPGGVMLTLRFDAPPSAIPAVSALVAQAATAARVTGAHLLITDDAASNEDSAEKRGRNDITPPPAWIILAEATDAEALAPLFPEAALRAAGALAAPLRGTYRLEFMRLKTSWGT
ncbi:hypothetical protein [Roseomonas sp. AR75]|uniref:hypothetical protein n=1 Tax=Roseomonas sp. AR75 TaxID=2562311 RepID=UPI0010BFC9DE|nr:hypothetical protein [Roseomonas sp. AR75]